MFTPDDINKARFTESFHRSGTQNFFVQIPSVPEEVIDGAVQTAGKDMVATMFDCSREELVGSADFAKKDFINKLRTNGMNDKADVLSNYTFSPDQMNEFLFAMIDDDDEEIADGNE